MNIPIALPIDKYGSFATDIFQFWLILEIPTGAIWKAAGMEGQGGQLLFVALEIFVNSFLCVIVGTVIGWIIYRNKTMR